MLMTKGNETVGYSIPSGWLNHLLVYDKIKEPESLTVVITITEQSST